MCVCVCLPPRSALDFTAFPRDPKPTQAYTAGTHKCWPLDGLLPLFATQLLLPLPWPHWSSDCEFGLEKTVWKLVRWVVIEGLSFVPVCPASSKNYIKGTRVCGMLYHLHANQKHPKNKQTKPNWLNKWILVIKMHWNSFIFYLYQSLDSSESLWVLTFNGLVKQIYFSWLLFKSGTYPTSL